MLKGVWGVLFGFVVCFVTVVRTVVTPSGDNRKRRE
jgi:hypothetical protein